MLCIMAFATGANATVIRVASTGNNGDGSTWAKAKTTITAAQNAATAGDIIYVKGEQFNFSSSTSGSSSWATKADINYYGGFAGVDDSETPVTRATSDLDNNGIVEPWEFSNATVINFTITNNGVGLNLNSNTATRYFDGFKFQGTFDYATTGSGNGQSLVKIGNYVIFQNNTLSDCTITGAPNSSTSTYGTALGSLFYVGGVASTVTNCLFENNTTTITTGASQVTDGQQNPLIYIVSASATGGNIFSNSIIRKNRVTLDYTALTTTPANYAGPRGMLLGMNITSTSISNSNVIKNVIIHNNDATFIPKGGTGTEQTTNGALLYVYGATQNNTDYILNCTVANNKMTRVGWGIKAGFNSGTQPYHIIANNVAFNNVNYVGDGSSALKNMTTNIAVSTSGSIRILNNYMNGGSGLQANGATTVVGNQTDLSDTNTDASKGAFFTSPSTPVGYSTDASVSKSLWIIGSGSYLKNKGVSNANITTDKAGRNFASTPSVGAYEQFYIRSKSSGNWNSLSSWETSNDNSTWNTSSEIPTSLASSLNIINGHEITITANATSPALTINSGGKLTHSSGSLTATNGITLESDASGTATLMDSYSSPTINATVKQYVTLGRNWYLSSPVSAADYTWLSRGTSVQGWDEATKAWVPVTNGTLVKGKGYVQVATTIVSPPSTTGTTGTVNVTGTTNSGDIAITVSRTESGSNRGFNLVGNPYPSYLKWTGANGFLAEATNDSISTSFWYRTKNSSEAYVFTTYNGSSHLVVGGSTVNSVLNEYIPPMQAFWIRVSANTPVTTHNVVLKFKNNMRFHGIGDNNKFKAPKNEQRKLLRLQLANGSQSDEALIYFDANAANTFDNYDSPKMMNNSATLPDLYTTIGAERLAINGLNEIAENMELPLGFTLKAATSGLTLKVSELSNFASGTKVYLLDKEQHSQTELLPSTQYSFNTTASTTNNESRFSLLFRAPGASTGIDNAEKGITQVFVNVNNQITIIAPEKASYSIYNAMGQLVENGIMNSKLVTQNSKLATGVYMVKVNNQSTRVIVK